MNVNYPNNLNRKRNRKSGVALLTVLAFLSIFAVLMVGFTYSLRVEEVTTRNYADSVNIQEASEASIQAVLSQVARDIDPAKEHTVLGRPQPHYISLLDPWAVGYAGKVGPRVIYDARSHIVDNRPERILPRFGVRVFPTPIPRGIDEDPEGDVTGQKRILQNTQTNSNRNIRGDGYAGLGLIDDDLDGLVDNNNSLPNDDDEDFREDEDGLDMRRPDLTGRFAFPAGTGYDADHDRLGVFDESAKLNINFAGNNANNGQFTYNLGVSPAELDVPVYLFDRVVEYLSSRGTPAQFSAADAEELARQIVNYRYGSTLDGGDTLSYPGLNRQDDNGNNDPLIWDVREFSKVFRTGTFNGEPFAIIGDGVDNDDDGLSNEEDERYIGPATVNRSGSPITRPLNDDNAENFRPGDGIDNDGDGYIDEQDEGIDDPAEFNVFKPKGDDKPYATIDDLKLVGAMRGAEPKPRPGAPNVPSLFSILRESTTIYGQSDEVSYALSGKKNEVAKINPNLASNWRPTDVWDLSDPTSHRVDFQYSPPVRIADLFPIQVDNDGDWQPEAEPDVQNGQGDGVDNDGDGLIDEPSDDWDGNFSPSGDFDGYAEAEVGSLALRNGTDDDGDGYTQDEPGSGDRELFRRLRRLGDASSTGQGNEEARPRDERDTDILQGMVGEGNGIDDDGDNLIDDNGDFNGDGKTTYDPEWHVNEDAWGDLSGDGYPGLGGDPDADANTAAGDLVERPKVNHDLLVTNFIDDDFDGYADFNDPQVLAAMYAPELDGVDNDNDGEVDEVGERYIAAYDDDEDGRMDEDPPEFQIALNLVDFVDTWGPYKATSDPDVRQLLGLSDKDAVLSDPVTMQTLELYTTRQRAFRMHPRMLAGPNARSRDEQRFTEQMRLLLPNPPQTGVKVHFEGVEAIRINEVMAKPVIHLEAEDALESINLTSENDIKTVSITANNQRFSVTSGQGDNGQRPDINAIDSDWGVSAPNKTSTLQVPLPNYQYLPDGFRHTNNLFGLVNMDALAPNFIFGVTNVIQPPANLTEGAEVGLQPQEVAEWTFENLPSGYYDVVLYMNPNHEYRPEVQYFFNGKQITMKSDTAAGDGVGQFVGLKPGEDNQILRDTARYPLPGTFQTYQLPYRLTAFPLPDQYRVNDRAQRVEIKTDGKLTVRIVATAPLEGYNYYETSFDRLELFNPRVQYVELVNLSMKDIDLSGWQINTPYGHYILPDNSIIYRMKPSWKEDNGRELVASRGMPGDGVPFEQMLTQDKIDNNRINGTDRDLEDNKLLIAFDKQRLIRFIRDNYPTVANLEERVVQPDLAKNEKAQISASVKAGAVAAARPMAQLSDMRFKLVDMQDDVLSNNPADKYVTLYDTAGNYVDSFKYRTTFNNAIVDIPGNSAGVDIVALPGYHGMESFERADPTNFVTDMKVNDNGELEGFRSVPSSIQLDVKDAVVMNINIANDGDMEKGAVGGNVSVENDPNNTGLDRFMDSDSEPAGDTQWNGWDFVGDWYTYPSKRKSNDMPLRSSSSTMFERRNAMAREAAAPKDVDQRRRFYDMLGGFENMTDFFIQPETQQMTLNQYDEQVRKARRDAPVTAFVWRMGLRELIRAGYDPEVDDQLTVRVLGRQHVWASGSSAANAGFQWDLPVGEVMTSGAVRIIDPGDASEKTIDNSDDPFHEMIGSRSERVPVFAKLRNGDTAFTLDLRQNFEALTRDLSGSSEAEPMIEIAVFMRKTTRDMSPTFQSLDPSAPLGAFAQIDRPDLPLQQGQFVSADQNGFFTLGAYVDDNYFFRGIELCGRGRSGNTDSEEGNKRRAYLAGTPGRDNTGYVPAYPRRRWMLTGNQRDRLDVIDNTAYVKNGPLATLGEISRLFTGNKFETVNTPIIPQRLEDLTVDPARIQSNVRLGQRVAGNDPEFRIQLAQRELLDQWENQYTNIYNMITTADNVVVPGLVNINTAPRELLAALPSAPLLEPGRLDTLQNRHFFNTLVADYIIEGREPGGRDMSFGIQDLDDDIAYSNFTKRQTPLDTAADYKLPTVGREPRAYKNFDDVRQLALDRLNIQPEDIKEDTLDFNDVYMSSIVSMPDDGPYSDIGTLLSQISHLRRRERFSDLLSRRPIDRTNDGKPDGIGDLRERLNIELTRELTPEDIEALMDRISNLITVRSRAFGIISRGRVFDVDGNITAQRRLETVYQR